MASIINKLGAGLILILFAWYYQYLVVPVAGTKLPTGACSFNWTTTMTNGNWTGLTNSDWTNLCN